MMRVILTALFLLTTCSFSYSDTGSEKVWKKISKISEKKDLYIAVQDGLFSYCKLKADNLTVYESSVTLSVKSFHEDGQDITYDNNLNEFMDLLSSINISYYIGHQGEDGMEIAISKQNILLIYKKSLLKTLLTLGFSPMKRIYRREYLGLFLHKPPT